MTALASPTLFGILVGAAIAGAAGAAVVLLALIVRDWRGGSLW